MEDNEDITSAGYLQHQQPWTDHDDNSSTGNLTRLDEATLCISQDIVFNFYMNFVIIGSVSICGLVGNTLSIVVLHRDPNNKVAINMK